MITTEKANHYHICDNGKTRRQKYERSAMSSKQNRSSLPSQNTTSFVCYQIYDNSLAYYRICDIFNNVYRGATVSYHKCDNAKRLCCIIAENKKSIITQSSKNPPITRSSPVLIITRSRLYPSTTLCSQGRGAPPSPHPYLTASNQGRPQRMICYTV